MKISKLKERHRAEYFKLLAENLNMLETSKQVTLTIEDTVGQIVEYVRGLNKTEQENFKNNPELYLNTKFIDIFLRSGLKFGKIFKEAITNCWKSSLEMGVQHQIDELLWDFRPLQQDLIRNRPVKISAFSTENFSNLVFNLSQETEEEEIAEFESISERNIRRAKAQELILYENIQELKRQGVYDSLARDTKLAARFSINERYRFLNSLNFIGNYVNKANAANRYYLGRTYFQQRISVLDTRYSQTQNNQIKQYIADYLKNNSVSMTELLNKDQSMRVLISKIEAKVRKTKNNRLIKENALVKATAILRTELSIGYNLGKLSGFMAPEDWDTEFIWNASYELENRRPDYEVCKFCDRMNGTVKTAREILEEGVRLDTSVLNYDARVSVTRWKDPDNPQIPYHVNCSCFWQIVPPDKKDLEESLVTSALPDKVKQEQKEKSITESILNPATTIGAGLLLVGTGLLLSRSNAFKEMLRAVETIPVSTSSIVDNTVVTYNSASPETKNIIKKLISSLF